MAAAGRGDSTDGLHGAPRVAWSHEGPGAVLLRLLVAVLVHRIGVDRRARRAPRPRGAVARDPAGCDVPGGRAAQPGALPDQARVQLPRLRTFCALRGCALRAARTVSDSH